MEKQHSTWASASVVLSEIGKLEQIILDWWAWAAELHNDLIQDDEDDDTVQN